MLLISSFVNHRIGNIFATDMVSSLLWLQSHMNSVYLLLFQKMCPQLLPKISFHDKVSVQQGNGGSQEVQASESMLSFHLRWTIQGTFFRLFRKSLRNNPPSLVAILGTHSPLCPHTDSFHLSCKFTSVSWNHILSELLLTSFYTKHCLWDNTK